MVESNRKKNSCAAALSKSNAEHVTRWSLQILRGLDKLGENILFVEKSYLATPDHFLSAIFGISVKFHVDIGVQKFFEIFFSR